MDASTTARLNRRRLLTLGAALAVAGTVRPVIAAPSGAKRATGGSVYLLRGFAGVFSAGIDAIDAQLRSAGVDAQIGSHLGWRSVAESILARSASGPVVLIGHSLGANAVISIAEVLERQNVKVQYLATFAATAPDPLPGNIERVVNFYFSHDGWGRPLVPGARFRGDLENRDFAGSADIGHFNIDKQPALQSEVVRDTLAALRRA